MKNSDFTIVQASNLRYEGMTTEVHFRGEQVALLDMDEGPGRVRVELLHDFRDASFSPRFPLDDFLAAIQTARSALLRFPDPTNPISGVADRDAAEPTGKP